MLEFKLGGVKKVSGQGNRLLGLGGVFLCRLDFPGCSIQHVSHHGMTNRRKMHTNLMRPSGFNFDFQQRKLSIWAIDFVQDFPVCNGLSSIASSSGHAGASDQITADRSINRAMRLVHPAVNESDIGFLDFTS